MVTVKNGAASPPPHSSHEKNQRFFLIGARNLVRAVLDRVLGFAGFLLHRSLRLLRQAFGLQLVGTHDLADALFHIADRFVRENPWPYPSCCSILFS